MVLGLLRKLFKSRNERYLLRCRAVVERINAIEAEYQRLGSEDFRALTPAFRKRVADGATLESILPEAFALVKNAARRLKERGHRYQIMEREAAWEMVHFDVQLLGGIVLHDGKIAEMATGEGKTLVATLATYLNSLSGRSVFVVTVNDYLARRDCEWMRPLYDMLGVTVGFIQSGMSPEERHPHYACSIVYGTNNEFGFDYLRDNMKHRAVDQVQKNLYYAIIDEVDSVLVDEARTPLIISGPSDDMTGRYQAVNQVARVMKAGVHFKLDEKKHSTAVTEEGIALAERQLGVGSLYSGRNMDIPHYLDNALKAHHLYKRDVDYIVKDGQEVIIIDEFTGRLMPGRRWSDGLHQAMEAKEGISVRGESQTLATITFQNYFRLFEKIAGMTGTALTEAEEFYEIYKLETIVLPTNRPMRREELPDVIYASEKAKVKAIIERIRQDHATGRPVLVGTISIEKSELLSGELERFGIKHEVLNAKQHQREAEIIAMAGQMDAVTIATNMAGRGTDIKLGPGVADKGGLVVLGTERHEARRIDNQLRGRTGRQGDPGTSQFYLSIEDDLMRIFAGEWVRNIMGRLGFDDSEPIESRLVSRQIEKAQKRVEERNFDIRRNLLEYDKVMNEQRTIVYQQRQDLLENRAVWEMIDDMLDVYMDVKAGEIPDDQTDRTAEDIQSFIDAMRMNFDVRLTPAEVEAHLKAHDLAACTLGLVQAELAGFRKRFGEEMATRVAADITRVTIDERWKEHLYEMDYLKHGIHMRGYAQVDPKLEYKREGYELFTTMADAVKVQVSERLVRVARGLLERAAAAEEMPNVWQVNDTRHTTIGSMDEAARVAADHSQTGGEARNRVVTIVNKAPEAGPNDPCPCGSGKKYKRCCRGK
ncbi:MAG: preprotein translocase subunit SecA [Planctomycetota bacterium]